MEKRRKIFVAFIDLEKVYDRVNREKLWEALRQAQVGSGAEAGLYFLTVFF